MKCICTRIRRWSLLSCFLFLGACGSEDRSKPAGEAAAAKTPTPNIVLILADDLGYGDVGVYNPDSKIPTPHIDQLAAAGMLFTDAHSPAAVCTPSRYALLTGRYAWRTDLKNGVTWGYSPPLIESDRLTLAQMLKSRGYATACVGKWHLGLGWQTKDGGPVQAGRTGDAGNVDFTKPILEGPNQRGFDYFFGMSVTLDFGPYCYIENDRTVGIPSIMKNSDHLPPRYREQTPSLTTPGFRDEQVGPDFTRKAVEWMKETVSEDPERPFFLYLPLHSPHVPHVPPDFIRGRSQAGRRGDMCAEVDWTVGEIMKAVDDLKISERTLVVFTSDNGPLPGDRRDLAAGETYKDYADPDNYETFDHLASGVYRGGKHSVYEGGHRVPLIVRWPGVVEAATRSDALICLTDFMATVAHILGFHLPADAGEDSFDFLPILKDPTRPGRESLVLQSALGKFAVRQGRWKMIQGQGGGALYDRDLEGAESHSPGQLYDLSQDPGERVNLLEKFPEVAQRLEEVLEHTLGEPAREE